MSTVIQVNGVVRLGRDPKSFGDKGASVSAVGGKGQYAAWQEFVFYNKKAELAMKYLKKGSLVYLSGELQGQKWNDKDGNERTKNVVVVQNMTFLPSGKGGGQSRSENISDDEVPF